MTSVPTIDELFALPRSEPAPELAAQWERIGLRNPWISEACDPPFKGARVRVCADRGELRGWLEFGNWSNGSAFAIEQGGTFLCFIQQGECSDEWLCVKTWPETRAGRAHLAFESISWHYILTRKADGPAQFEAMLDDLFAATPEECSALAYTGAAERRQQDAAWTPRYSHWRHGGWYVTNVRYPSGACGCVSRNYADRKWRIVCDNTGPGSEGDRTFPSRDAAARAERERAQAAVLAAG